LLSVDQQRSLGSSTVAIPWKKKRCEPMGVASSDSGKRRKSVKYRDSLNRLRPKQQCLAPSFGQNTIKNG
jgi:hypothetical protein